jgi:hypothetical protein
MFIGLGVNLHSRYIFGGGEAPPQIASLGWDSVNDTYVTTGSGPISTHLNMKRCLLLDNGTVNYYLDPTDSTLKATGGAADLTGADGMVMVEIPKFYTKREVVGNVTTWSISDKPVTGFVVHPAFIKDGVEVDKRYYGAYDACYFRASDSTYQSGLNLDALAVSTANDKLASVAGIYPIVGVTRAACRSLAANRGTGWRQLDFTLWSAVQMLYLTEYGTFNSQSVLGAGNTNGSYLSSSSNQNQSPHTIAGASNSIGNGSTNTTTGAGVDAKPGTSFMSYRGIENFYGNCWNWADGINVNVTANGNVHVTNTRADFADNTSTNMTLLTSSLPTGSGFIRNLLAIDDYFLSSTNSGGSSTSFITDQHFASTSSNRVVLVGGSASSAASAGAFCLDSRSDSSARNRSVGARLAL